MTTAFMEETQTVTAQEKWSQADTSTREEMLRAINFSTSFAGTSWRKLAYLIRVNLEKRTWAA